MNRRAARHAGYTLVELLVALAIGAGMLSLAGTLLARAIAANAAATDHMRGVVALGALGQQFRRDVHATSGAATSAVDGQPARLLMNLPDGGRIEYEISAAGLVRTQTSDGQPRRRESFSLPGMKALGFKADPTADGEVSIFLGRLSGRPDDASDLSGRFEITAVVPRGGREERKL